MSSSTSLLECVWADSFTSAILSPTTFASAACPDSVNVSSIKIELPPPVAL